MVKIHLTVQETQETRAWPPGQEAPLSRKWQATAILLPGEFHRQRSLAIYSPWVDVHRVRHDWATEHNEILASPLQLRSLRLWSPFPRTAFTIWGCGVAHTFPAPAHKGVSAPLGSRAPESFIWCLLIYGSGCCWLPSAEGPGDPSQFKIAWAVRERHMVQALSGHHSTFWRQKFPSSLSSTKTSVLSSSHIRCLLLQQWFILSFSCQILRGIWGQVRFSHFNCLKNPYLCSQVSTQDGSSLRV